jgi:hypothetical protein
MGGACSLNEGEEPCVQVIREKSRVKETIRKYQDVGVWMMIIIIRWILVR